MSSFETQTVDAPLEMVTDSFAITGFILDVVPDVSPEPWLRKQMLIRDDRPTVGSILIFADEPQTVLPKQSGIKLYRYTTADDVGSRANLYGQPITIEGNAYDQIRARFGERKRWSRQSRCSTPMAVDSSTLNTLRDPP